jgi:integrase
MLSQNVPPKDVQVIAGHASYKTTMDIYGHLMPGAQREAAEKMDKLFEV